MNGYKIAIIGIYGHVGSSIAGLFEEREDYDIVGYDLDFGSKEGVNSCSLAIICVPTPEGRGGSCDTTIVEGVVSWLKTPLILIKSTIAPRTTETLKKRYKKRIVFSPEYYGESKYHQPKEWGAREWPYMIVGGDKEDCQQILDIFVPVLGPTKKYFITDATTAEVVKYWENVFGAMKVTFSNEMFEICKKFGVKYDEARELWAQDTRVSRCHTSVFVKNRGFSGKCFPKDLSAFIKASEEAGYEPSFLKEVQTSNARFLAMNKK